MITDIQLDTFRHLSSDEVEWVTAWALTLAALSDDGVTRVWSQVNGGR